MTTSIGPHEDILEKRLLNVQLKESLESGVFQKIDEKQEKITKIFL